MCTYIHTHKHKHIHIHFLRPQQICYLRLKHFPISSANIVIRKKCKHWRKISEKAGISQTQLPSTFCWKFFHILSFYTRLLAHMNTHVHIQIQVHISSTYLCILQSASRIQQPWIWCLQGRYYFHFGGSWEIQGSERLCTFSQGQSFCK